MRPDTPKEGLDRKNSLAKKFGSEQKARSIYENIREAGVEVDIGFQFDAIARTPNTIDAHRVVYWALEAGSDVQDRLVEELFDCYFVRGKDVGDKTILLDAVAEVGLNRFEFSSLLDSDKDIDLIEREDQLAREMGVTGVPCFIINNQYMLMGAQDPQRLAKGLATIYAEEVEIAKKGGIVNTGVYGSL